MISYFHSLSPSLDCITRTNFGPYPWHVHQLKHIRSTLFRLRSGHCKLRGFYSKIDPNINSDYIHENCPFKEDADHVIFDCPHYNTQRIPLLRLLSSYCDQPSLETVFGLNLSLPDDAKFKIQKTLVKFLVETNLIFCIRSTL